VGPVVVCRDTAVIVQAEVTGGISLLREWMWTLENGSQWSCVYKTGLTRAWE
jgi:hypothetical protein